MSDESLKSAEVLLLSGKKKKAELLEDITYLHQLAAAQDVQLDKLKKQLIDKLQEIEHLKKMLASVTPNLIKTEAENEEIIAESQLRKLKEQAANRELTLEEARKLEIFSKIKQNAVSSRPIIPQWSALPESIPSRDLIQIAEMSTYKEKATDEQSSDE